MFRPAELARFAADGYAVLPGFVSPSEIAVLRERAAAIVAAADVDAASVFSTRRDAASRDEYFLSSGTTVRCFFEEEAFDDAGRLRAPKELSVNKIGHALHELDSTFAAFSYGAALQRTVEACRVVDPRVYQSMYIFKQPHIGGVVDWHQDASFFATEPQSVITFWFALERADCTNGCLWVEPGGHRGALREQFVVEGAATRMACLDDTPWPALERAEPVEVDAGTLVLMHGLLPHYSAPNRSATSRHAYTLHVVDGRARYDERNWLQRDAAFPARGFVEPGGSFPCEEPRAADVNRSR